MILFVGKGKPWLGHYFLVWRGMDKKDFWISVLNRLQPTIKKAHFLTWFQNTTIVEKKNGTVTVGVPTTFAQNWISAKYDVKILQSVQELDSSITKIEYEVVGKLSDEGNHDAVDVRTISSVEDDQKKVRKVRDLNEVIVARGSSTRVSSQMMNDRYKLGNFVVGLDNRLPHAACQAVSSIPGGIYNPLYIYGSVGLGKTHLLQAVGNEILKKYPDKIVKYITAERFVTEIVEAISKRYMKSFKEQYRNVDCFLIDDVQFFARKDSSQQEFFYTFNELYDGNKQIVLTSDRAPSELQELDERLKSRFGMGMVVEILPPDFETRLAILGQKCAEYEMIVDPEILYLIANNLTGSVRGLEGVLKQVSADCRLFDKVPTIRSVAEIIKRTNRAQKIIGYDSDLDEKAKIVKSAMDVIQIVASYYNVTVEDVIGKDRHGDVMLPRQVSMYLIKNELGESYEKIGEGFGGRNHTTVMHACNKTAKELRTNLRLVKTVNAIKRDMGL